MASSIDDAGDPTSSTAATASSSMIEMPDAMVPTPDMSYYEVLRVAQDATQDEIRDAYRQLSLVRTRSFARRWLARRSRTRGSRTIT